MVAIETKKLQKVYNGKQVVKGIDLVVNKGELFGFLGRNGAGKSTFINMMTGIIKPTSGSYSILGINGQNDAVKKRIGVMPDYSTFYDSLTALEHLKYLAGVSGKTVSKGRCLEVLKLVGLEEDAHKKAGKFSFGMKKKLGVAQAIIHDPELLFLDEPTSGLDAESAIQVQQLILKLQQSGKTIFMTSHNLHEVEKICTRIAIMQDGQIVRSGTMAELRAYYQSAITVRFKLSEHFASARPALEPFLQAMGTNLEFAEPFLTLQVDSEKKIAEIIRTFTEYKIDIYRVAVDEPSLEDIFLDNELN